ncbi:TIGR01906 family membrane protein [Alkaliphilus pronyensis]|uniref:TIGR01906 family membrane protein n=1 Tax=Alkaliphilus pronyensis TaxID=1482732 RepID=A0A6I0F844_9FIRM|nr:TIGR01906 family membrane protein [Alkaliphilus pronyensis]KAB3534049.1 TIGR01906 family membrane protein [Alkaliphilus pronyensis]
MKLKGLSYILIGVLLSIIILLTAVDLVTFNVNHYLKSFEKHQIPNVTGRTVEELRFIIEDLLEYLKDQRKLLDTTEIIEGEERQIFGERAVLHMIDVKALFVGGALLRNFSIPLLLIILIYNIWKDSKWKKNLAKTLYYTATVNILLLFTLLLLMNIDFNKYFTYFHYIFFDNDLWILDPKTEILIQMLPEKFFFETATKIITVYMLSIITFGIFGFLYNRKNKGLGI